MARFKSKFGNEEAVEALRINREFVVNGMIGSPGDFLVTWVGGYQKIIDGKKFIAEYDPQDDEGLFMISGKTSCLEKTK